LGTDEKVSIGMIVICPSTGDVAWDQFEGMFSHCIDCFLLTMLRIDNNMRTELEV
jgi:DNA mismatch repair protein MSH3